MDKEFSLQWLPPEKSELSAPSLSAEKRLKIFKSLKVFKKKKKGLEGLDLEGGGWGRGSRAGTWSLPRSLMRGAPLGGLLALAGGAQPES